MECLRGGYRLAALTLVFLLYTTNPVDAQPREQPRFGGVLKVATIGEPPSLDPHWSPSVVTSIPMWHVFETLYTFDKDWSPIPHLAEGHTVTDGGRRYTITLRKGVRFHNGKELTAADVVASLNRWSRVATLGKALWKSVEAVDAKGSHEVVIGLKQPSADLISSLAVGPGGAAIYPKEIIDATGDGQLKQFIGTGPFRFVEHRPDRHVRLARFKEYAARSDPPNGAVLTLRSVEPRVFSPNWVSAVLNHKLGLMTSKKLRQAFQAALDMQPIMAAAVGHPLFYRMDPGLWPPELIFQHSTAGGALYNQGDKEKARRFLKEAAYTGEPIRWLTTQEYEHFYKSALVAKQQLEEIGVKIDLQVLDFATLMQRWSKLEQGAAGRLPLGAVHVLLERLAREEVSAARFSLTASKEC